MQIVLSSTAKKTQSTVAAKELKTDGWAEATVDFAQVKGGSADEIRFLLPNGAVLLIDDVLLYEPGEK